MKRTCFYTMQRVNNKPAAVRVNGYFDGRFYYYRNPSTAIWHAVCPLTGLALASEDTRRETERRAYSLIPEYNAYMDEFGERLKLNYKRALYNATILDY